MEKIVFQSMPIEFTLKNGLIFKFSIVRQTYFFSKLQSFKTQKKNTLNEVKLH